jgi:hypothetical protein
MRARAAPRAAAAWMRPSRRGGRADVGAGRRSSSASGLPSCRRAAAGALRPRGAASLTSGQRARSSWASRSLGGRPAAEQPPAQWSRPKAAQQGLRKAPKEDWAKNTRGEKHGCMDTLKGQDPVHWRRSTAPGGAWTSGCCLKPLGRPPCARGVVVVGLWSPPATPAVTQRLCAGAMAIGKLRCEVHAGHLVRSWDGAWGMGQPNQPQRPVQCRAVDVSSPHYTYLLRK